MSDENLFLVELGRLLDRHNKDLENKTLERILAEFLDKCLQAFGEAIQDRR